MTAPPMDPTMQPPDGALNGAVVASVIRDLFGPEAATPGQSPDESKANQITAPNPPESDDIVEPIARYRGLMQALYGSGFPLITAFDELTSQNPQYEMTGQMPTLEEMLPLTKGPDWVSWTRNRWNLHGAAVQMHLYLVARNRLFRGDQQWVSSRSAGPWQTPPRAPESARVVHNMIRPALDQRIQTITDQRPSFDVDPSSMSPEEKRKAEGRQQALEFQYDQQKMEAMTSEASYWAGTDGVAFWQVYWDREAGPWDQRMGALPDQKKPLGDLRTKTLRCEQVRVSANATANEAPDYAIVRDVIPETEAAYLYGAAGVVSNTTDGDDHTDGDASGGQSDGILPSWVLTQTVVGEGYRLSNIKTVERFTIYVDKHPDILPDGLQLVVLGNSVVWGPGELLFGCIPVIPVRDGSTDPSYYPRPIMEGWVLPQMRINAALSLWVNSVRANSGGRLLAKPDAISRETFIGSGLSIIEVEAPNALGDVVQPMQGFLVGQDVKDLIAFDVKAFEDMSGYNAVSRGEVSTETATAVAAANEHIQRIFAPPVQAVARAFEQWATVNLAGMAWGYDIPRDVGSVGSDRPDLARALSAQDFDGPSTVRVNADKMLPMPKVYRVQMMDGLLQRNLITNQQYMRNLNFGDMRNLATPDEDQEARAKRIADAIRTGQQMPPNPDPQQPNPDLANQPYAIRWTDNESIHQDVLEREILTQDDLDPQIVGVASARWSALAAQAQQKMLPAPGSGQASYQQFMQDTTQKVELAASALIAREVSVNEGLVAPAVQPDAPIHGGINTPVGAGIGGPPGAPGAGGPPLPVSIPGHPGGQLHAPLSPLHMSPGSMPTTQPLPSGPSGPSASPAVTR